MKKLICIAILCNFLYASSEHQGIVYSKQEINLSFPLDGIISKIYVKDGDVIKKDAVILKLDDELQALEVERRKEILDDNSEYSANKQNLEIIESLLSSTKELYEKSASVSKDELSNLQMQYLNLKGKVDSHKSKKNQENVEYKISKEVLNRYKLNSPINGVITNLNYEEGEWAKIGEIALTIIDVDNCYVELNIEEPIARNIKLNSKVKVFTNNNTISKDAIVSYIAPLAESTSALVKVRVLFKNTVPRITPGVIARVIFNPEEKFNDVKEVLEY